MEQPGDVAHALAQVLKRNGVLQLLLIKRPPLGAANTPSICQRGPTARAVTSQPAKGAAEADSVLGGQLREAEAFLQCWITSQSRPRCVRRALGWLCMGV